MEQTQLEVEQKYSRKSIRAKVMADIETDHPSFKTMVKAINGYKAGSYYESKQKRVAYLLGTPSEVIATEIFIVTLPIKIVSPIQAVATQLGTNLNIPELLDAVKTAAELLAVCESAGIYTIYHSSSSENPTGTMGIKAHYSLEPDTEDFINQTKYLPPMVCRPIEWTENSNGGHLQGSSSLLLGHLNHHEGNQALDVINIMQNIAWSLNEVVDYVEKPSKPLDTAEKSKQFTDFQQKSLEVYEELIALGNKFYFVWKYDKRGRMYSQGYHCNLQGTQYKKAILNFTKEELIK